jgi:RNA-binding protein
LSSNDFLLRKKCSGLKLPRMAVRDSKLRGLSRHCVFFSILSQEKCNFIYGFDLTGACGSEGDSLRRLGKILHYSKSRSLIVKCDEACFVKMGTKACDNKLKEIGRIHDIFGPVSTPYLAVRPTVSTPAKFVGRIAYSLD